MKIVAPSFEIEPFNSNIILANIEKAGRTCYKSEDKITAESAVEFVRMIISRGHESVLEHEKLTVRFICDRGVSHELVRHRIASFSQESTRYCNYASGKFDGELTFVRPILVYKSSANYYLWEGAMKESERYYLEMIKRGIAPQDARSVLPNSLKTEIVVTANLREWRTIFKQRTSPAAHPQMREIMCPLLRALRSEIPVIFADIEASNE